MKQFIPFIVLIAIFACILTVVIGANTRENYRQYVQDLQEQGYSPEWATHKALVEYDYIERDELYDAIEED